MKIRLCGAALSMLAVCACATRRPAAPTPAATPGQGFSAAADALPGAREKKILDLLSGGDVAPAKVEAQALVAEQPDNREARVLLMEIEEDPKTLFGELSSDVTAKAGDTFASLAERYLRDGALAYALARYNGVNPPNQPTPGQTVQIPGSIAEGPRGEAAARRREPAETRSSRSEPARQKPAGEKAAAEKPAAEKPAPDLAAPSSSEPAAPKPAPAPTPKHSEPLKPASAPRDPVKAASLRSNALVLMNKGDIDHAVELLRQAAALDPENVAIKADLDRASRIQHGPHPGGGAP